MTDKGPSALSTPSRESDPQNNNNTNNGGQYNNRQTPNTNTTNGNESGQNGTEAGVAANGSKNGVASGSCLAGPDNPKTVTRKNLSLTGNEVIVHFDERVVVHTVPYWDPCGETYYDDDDQNERTGPNCCTIL